MGIEIERKFLPRNDDWRKLVNRTIDIQQGYLAEDNGTILRIRIVNVSGSESAQLCIKGKSINGSTPEYEYPINANEARELLEKLAKQPPLTKRRHIVSTHHHQFEIDEFGGHLAGLTLIEVELDFPEQSVTRPPWIGVEVTKFPEYYNAVLIKNGIPHNYLDLLAEMRRT